MSRALTGDAPIENHYKRARRDISNTLNSPGIFDWLGKTDDEVVRHFVEPKNGYGGWELAPLEVVGFDLDSGRATELSGDIVRLTKAMIQLAPHPNNDVAVTILPAGGWPEDDGLERTASFNMGKSEILIHAPEPELERLVPLARSRIDLINKEIEEKGPEFRASIATLVRERRQALEAEAERIGVLRDRLGGKKEAGSMSSAQEPSEELIPQRALPASGDVGGIVQVLRLIDDLSRQLRAVYDRLNAVDMPPGPKGRVNEWKEELEQGRVSVTDWDDLKHDIREVFQFVEESQAAQEYRSSLGMRANFIRGIQDQQKKIATTLAAIDELPAGSLKSALESNQEARQSEIEQEVHVMQSREPVVAICHGHSDLYLQLRDFLERRHGVKTTYFENESRTSKSMKEFLTQFGDEATHAVIVLTADDLQASGETRARQNVIHEIGYFQGRLGFDKVAILVQDGVEEVSNIDGIVPITFYGHRIKGVFVDVEEWLEREGCPRRTPS